jgi:acyl-CoA thioester hydrolase
MEGFPGEDGIFRASLEVPQEAIDENGHVNNVVYVQWMQDVAVQHSLSCGGTAAMEKAGGTWVIRSHTIFYLRPAFAGDVLEIITWVANIRRVRSLRKYEFARKSDGELLARGETDWVFLDAGSGRPVPVPDEVADCFPVVER